MRMSLAAARVNKKLTQEQVAQAMGVAKKTVWSWENGRTLPSLEKIEPLCNLYGLTYDDIEWNA